MAFSIPSSSAVLGTDRHKSLAGPVTWLGLEMEPLSQAHHCFLDSVGDPTPGTKDEHSCPFKFKSQARPW